MTLTEYLNQENPTKGNKVILNSNEFKKLGSYNLANENCTHIRVLNYPQYNYVLKGTKGFIHTTDEDGNIKGLSTFYIESLT